MTDPSTTERDGDSGNDGDDRAPDASDEAPDPRLLEILVCPETKGPLEYDRENKELISRSARLAYPIRDGIPIMLPEEARPLSDDEAP